MLDIERAEAKIEGVVHQSEERLILIEPTPLWVSNSGNGEGKVDLQRSARIRDVARVR
jgi:hypothetical protein